MKSISLEVILNRIPSIQVFEDETFTTGNPFNTEFDSVCSHSNDVQQGYLFVIPNNDAKWISVAVQHGATGILCSKEIAINLHRLFPHVLFLHSENVRRALTHLSALFFEGQPKYLAAVTGTNGKTSVVNIARQILGKLGMKAASLGTLGCSTINVLSELPQYIDGVTLTTFDPVNFHRILQTLSKMEVEYLALEASSIGLQQCRLDGVKFQVAVFTNLTQDHLDYHANMNEYFAAKCLLFKERMLPKATVILSNNLSAEHLQILMEIAAEQKLTVWLYGDQRGDLHYLFEHGELIFSLWGSKSQVKLPGGFKSFPFLIENILAVIGVVKAMNSNINLQSVLSALEHITTVEGRLEEVWSNEDFKIIIDEAHSPGGFQKTIPAVRAATNGKLIIVFGCGGNRDKLKRPIMGNIASYFADHIIVTDDNCRFEDPAIIRQMILEGIEKRSHLEEIGDRRAAIERGINIARNGHGNTLLILGRGAEFVMEINGQFIPWNDKDVVRQTILQEMVDR